MLKKTVIPMLCGLCFVGCSCRKNPIIPPVPVYDSRNVSRNATISANSFITVENTGKVHIVWRDDNNGKPDIYYSVKTTGGSWSPPQNISSNNLESTAPQITLDPTGNVQTIWDELGSGISYVAYSYKPQGSSWVTPEDISTAGGSGSGSLPQIGIDGVGKVYVVYDGGGGALYHTIRDLGNIWSTPTGFETLRSFGNPALAVSPDGQMHVVYENNIHEIMYKHRTVTGVWDSAVSVSNSPGNYCWNANVAIDNSGNAYAAWTDATSKEVYFALKTIGDSVFATPINISNSVAGSWLPKMAISLDGIVHYIWAEDITAGVCDIYYKKRNTDGSWTNAINISNTSSDSRPNCIVYTVGKIHFSWSEWPEGEVYYDTYPK